MTLVCLEAWCDYVTEAEYRDELGRSSLPAHHVEEALEDFRRGADFRVQERAVLEDGRRLPLGAERGFTSTSFMPGRSEPVDPWADLRLEELEASVRTTVLPDEDPTDEEHPYEWLAERLREHGLDATAGQLRRLPYEVVFSERLLARIRRP